MTRKQGKTGKTGKHGKTIPALGANVTGAPVLSAWRGSAPTSPAKKPTPARPGRVAVSYKLDADLVERLTRTVWHLQGPPLVLRAVDVIEAGLRHELARLERERNGGKAYPAVPEGRRVRGGRRPGSGRGAWGELGTEMERAAGEMRERGRRKR